MAKSCLLGLLQLLCLSSAFYQTDSTLCVLNSTDAQSSHQYLTSQCESYVNFSRESLSADSDYEISIHLCSSVFEIGEQDVVIFRDMVSVSIIRVEGRSTLHCQNGTTGLQFINVTTVEIGNVILDQCSFSNTIDHFEVNFSSSIYISGCTTVSITNVTVRNTVGVGLALIENEYISITNSTFMNNRPGNTSAGGGVFIESSTIENGSFVIENCNFTNNSAKNDSMFENEFGKSNSDDVIDFVRGGGMNVYFRGETHHVNLTILDCQFDENTALHGGALQISFTGSSHDINVHVNQSNFTCNRAQKKGGAVGIGFNHELLEKKQNLIEFSNCNFSNNRAWQGGGVYLYATPTNYTNCNRFHFYKCLWTNNRATYGAAIKMNPYTTTYRRLIRDKHFPKALFRDCMFIANDAVHHNHSINTTISNTTYQIRNHGKGILLAHKLQTILQGMTRFERNIGSAVYLLSSILEIEQGSNITFVDNHGYEGGAIGLQGSSVIYINDNINISFLNNSASVKGGAISQKTLHTPSDMTASKCFIKYAGDYSKNITERNITLFFYNNTIHPYNVKLNSSEIHKQSIFVFSDLPCMKINMQAKNYLKALNSIAHFNFTSSNDIAAISSKFEVNDIPKKIIPGKKTYMNITLRDGLDNNDSSSAYSVSITQIYNGKVFFDPVRKYKTSIANNMLKVLGKPKSKAKIRITLSNLQDTELSFDITLQECPPGYIFDKENSKCTCSLKNGTLKYQGIHHCNNKKFRAFLIPGYWAGYNTSDESEITSNYFRTAQCPQGFCKFRPKFFHLPKYASINEINDKVCNHRHGRVCAKCNNGTSVYYHTQHTFDCKTDKYCSWGIVLYILSEIVPATILFLIVILFDIKLTSGALNAFIFYTQIFETLKINPEANKFLEFLNLIVSFFNLKFFAHSKLSFCLFKGATSLDIIAFNYVTVIYSLFLVLLTIALMNTRLNRFNKYIQKIKGRKTYISQSIIHGLSGFLIICYARSTNISLQILSPVTLLGKDMSKEEKVVFYYGELYYFERDHLAYAIPAIFALIVMSLLPPLLLLSYPLCYKILALFRIQESKFTRILCKIFPLEKFKPFFDSFQGSFKDEYRYFAGLYFLYRLSALLMYTFNDYLGFLLELQFILTLTIHSWIQPYKKKWHNRLDIFLFTLLAILNGISMWNYHLRLSPQDFQHYINIWYGIQLFLAYIPLLFTVGYILTKITKKIATRWHLRVRFRRSERNSEPSFILEQETSLMMSERDKQKEFDNLSYQKCQ